MDEEKLREFIEFHFGKAFEELFPDTEGLSEDDIDFLKETTKAFFASGFCLALQMLIVPRSDNKNYS